MGMGCSTVGYRPVNRLDALLVDDWLFDPAGRGARSGLPL
jgi:hypothetical protein